MQQQIARAVQQADIEAIWWVLQWVVLPAIVSGYGMVLGLAKWLHGTGKEGREKLWDALHEVRMNEIKHLQDEIDELKRQLQGD